MSASKAATKRLTKEYTLMQKEPPPFIWAVPEERNILIWNFLIRGPPDSPFAGGEYHGVLIFPPEYPFKPPGIKMYTPSGRFAPDKKICFSMSDFHPGSWNPAWSVATILTGLLSFMLSDEMTTGSVTSSPAHKQIFAQRSHGWNIALTTREGGMGNGKRFREAFPEYAGEEMRDLPNMGEGASKSKSANASKGDSDVVTPSVPVTSVPVPAATPVPAAAVVPVPVVPEGTGRVEGVLAAVWEKWGWRWGVVIMLAVLVSRMSSAGK